MLPHCSFMKQILALSLTAALAGCQTAATPVPASPSACDIVSSSDWAAWVNAMPGPNAQPKLIVTGKAEVPTGGYRFEWRDLIVMESYPVQIIAEIVPVRSTGYVTEAHVVHDVRGEWPMSPPVGALTVRCAGKVLARIAPVQTAS